MAFDKLLSFSKNRIHNLFIDLYHFGNILSKKQAVKSLVRKRGRSAERSASQVSLGASRNESVQPFTIYSVTKEAVQENTRANIHSSSSRNAESNKLFSSSERKSLSEIMKTQEGPKKRHNSVSKAFALIKVNTMDSKEKPPEKDLKQIKRQLIGQEIKSKLEKINKDYELSLIHI
eukprot:TRINITY_DN6246_c0_g1_i2.p2 TRINITY_DN6246_c0_g1~~TRINITY_DN6246_c0_g1_i2.p2  ORF type:complete len:176 (-),score=25.58 TRINITY_DN6246_c0_g1_i2:134-661(-)